MVLSYRTVSNEERQRGGEQVDAVLHPPVDLVTATVGVTLVSHHRVRREQAFDLVSIAALPSVHEAVHSSRQVGVFQLLLHQLVPSRSVTALGRNRPTGQ